MKIRNLKYVATAVLVGGCVLSTNIQLHEMKVEIQEAIDDINEKNEIIDQKIEDLRNDIVRCQLEQKELVKTIELLLQEDNQRKEEESTILVEDVESNIFDNKVTGLVISSQVPGQYDLSFYQTGNKPYKFVTTKNLRETLSNLEEDCRDDIRIVYIDGCIDSSVLQNLSGFEKLNRLCLENCSFSDLRTVGKLDNLEYLSITNCPNISNINPLRNLDLLSVLILNNTKVQDVSPLASLVNLEELDLRNNNISNPGFVENLPKLTNVWLDGNSISDASLLQGFISRDLMNEEDAKNIVDSSCRVNLKK